jgi:sugar transferase (PEP-CTERM/EpsH1 system associated)
MRILYLAHRIPYPPNKGEKIRAFHQIRLLSRKHTVHLACLIDEKEDLQHVKALAKYCASVDAVYRGRTSARGLSLLTLLTSRPLSVMPFYSRKLAKKIANRLRSERIDRILVFSSSMAKYVRHIAGIAKVLDFVDMDSEKWRLYADYHPFPFSWIYRLEADRLGRYEEEVASIFDHSLFVSEKDAELLRRRLSDRPISVISNGVDLDYFAPNGGHACCSNPPVLVFTGAMDYFPNIDAVQHFCQTIFPLVRKARPEVRFSIVGRNPTRLVKALGHHPHVTVTGSVSDVRPYLTRAQVAVVPLRIARGVQNKVLEAMAMGLPVVGTSQAFQGLQATTSDGVRIVDAPEAFAQEVLTLLEDHALQRQRSLQARHYVQCHHQWQGHGASLESLLQAMS